MHTRETKNLAFTMLFARQLALALTARPAGALFAAANVRLWKDVPFAPTPASLEADFSAHECDFTDYAAAAVAVAVPINFSTYVPGATGIVTFTMVTSPPVITNTVRGYWVEVGGIAVAYEMFSDADLVSMVNLGDRLNLILDVPFQCLLDTLA